MCIKTLFIICLAAITLFSMESPATADTLTQRDTTIIQNPDTSVQQDTSETFDLDTEAVAEDFATRLKSQLNLSDEQFAEVESILLSFIESFNAGEDDTDEWDMRIEDVLINTQVEAWRSVKDAFWNDLESRLRAG